MIKDTPLGRTSVLGRPGIALSKTFALLLFGACACKHSVIEAGKTPPSAKH